MSEIVKNLTNLSLRVGDPAADLTILAEGNAGAVDLENDRFLVKASGVIMCKATEEDWVYLPLSKCIEILEDANKNGISQKGDKALDDLLQNSVTPNGTKRKASIETLVHVVAFHLMGAKWSLHTHPTPVVALASSKDGPAHYAGTLFPDESVTCGPNPLFLPYAEPGLTLGLGVYQGVAKFMDEHGRAPGQIILGNHGLCTSGSGVDEALATTEIAVKAARVRIGALSAGGISFLPQSAAEKIAFRPDEVARRKLYAKENK